MPGLCANQEIPDEMLNPVELVSRRMAVGVGLSGPLCLGRPHT